MRHEALTGARGNVFTMLVGTGVDSVEVERVARSIERFGRRFLQRIYAEGEIAYCTRKKRSAESFAARFAAKEAAAKALGTGISQGVTWLQIEVVRSSHGRPALELSGEAGRVARRLGVRTIALSLTHTEHLATAIVLMES